MNPSKEQIERWDKAIDGLIADGRASRLVVSLCHDLFRAAVYLGELLDEAGIKKGDEYFRGWSSLRFMKHSKENHYEAARVEAETQIAAAAAGAENAESQS